MNDIENFVCRDDISTETKAKVISIIQDLSSTITCRIYGNNDYIKELLDKGRYTEVVAVSDIFNSIVQKCKAQNDELTKCLQSLPEGEILGKDSNK